MPNWLNLEARKILLVGYGCVNPFEPVPPDGYLRQGFAHISVNGPVRLITGTPQITNDRILCRGDSGGAAYRAKKVDAVYEQRVIIGVNSANLLSYRQSFLAKTSAPAFVRFFHQWRNSHNHPKVCGLDADIAQLCNPCASRSLAPRDKSTKRRAKPGRAVFHYLVTEDNTRKPTAGAHNIHTQIHRPFIFSSAICLSMASLPRFDFTSFCGFEHIGNSTRT